MHQDKICIEFRCFHIFERVEKKTSSFPLHSPPPSPHKRKRRKLKPKGLPLPSLQSAAAAAKKKKKRKRKWRKFDHTRTVAVVVVVVVNSHYAFDGVWWSSLFFMQLLALLQDHYCTRQHSIVCLVFSNGKTDSPFGSSSSCTASLRALPSATATDCRVLSVDAVVVCARFE